MVTPSGVGSSRRGVRQAGQFIAPSLGGSLSGNAPVAIIAFGPPSTVVERRMAADLVLRGAQLADRHAPVDVVIEDGRIVDLGTVGAAAARETIDLRGRVVTPGLVESHIHLDKAFLDDRITPTWGTLDEAIRLTGEAKREFTIDDIRARARRALDL